MHELSIVMSIVDIAQSQAQQAHAQAIEEIELDIGNLAGVELDALEFAWPQGVKNTMLEKAVKRINRIEGLASCRDCNNKFTIGNFCEAGAECDGHRIRDLKRRGLRGRSLVII